MNDIDVAMGEAIIGAEVEWFLRIREFRRQLACLDESRRILDVAAIRATEALRRFAEVLNATA